jgi:hypothetical protein
MKLRKILVIAGIVTAFILAVPAGQVWAGADTPPPTSGSIDGPELWGVIVLSGCGGTVNGTLRVKKIENCVVDTEAVALGWTGCPANASAPLWVQLTGVTLFGDSRVPIITKVKNFKVQGSVVSFDAQIKFYTP